MADAKQPEPVKLVRVRARTRGYLDLRKTGHPHEYQVGDVFEVPEHLLANRWLERLPDAPAAEPVQPTQPAPIKTGGKSVI
jgi:hypothetical protein